MTATGVGDRLRRDGFVHHGINLAFGGEMHRINLFEASGGRAVTVYAQDGRCSLDGAATRQSMPCPARNRAIPNPVGPAS
jgi:hypothetical protein